MFQNNCSPPPGAGGKKFISMRSHMQINHAVFVVRRRRRIFAASACADRHTDCFRSALGQSRSTSTLPPLRPDHGAGRSICLSISSTRYLPPTALRVERGRGPPTKDGELSPTMHVPSRRGFTPGRPTDRPIEWGQARRPSSERVPGLCFPINSDADPPGMIRTRYGVSLTVGQSDSDHTGRQLSRERTGSLLGRSLVVAIALKDYMRL